MTTRSHRSRRSASNDSGYWSDSRSRSSRSSDEVTKIIKNFGVHGGAAITAKDNVIICFGTPEDGERQFTANGSKFTFVSKHTNNPFSTFEARIHDGNGGTRIHNATFETAGVSAPSRAPNSTRPNTGSGHTGKSRRLRYNPQKAATFDESQVAAFAKKHPDQKTDAGKWAGTLETALSEHATIVSDVMKDNILNYTASRLAHHNARGASRKKLRSFTEGALTQLGIHVTDPDEWKNTFSAWQSQVYPSDQTSAEADTVSTDSEKPFPDFSQAHFDEWVNTRRSPKGRTACKEEAKNWAALLVELPGMSKHNMDSHQDYMDAIAYTATQLTDAHGRAEKAPYFADIITDFVQRTGHSYEVNSDSAKSMREEITECEDSGECAWPKTKLYTGLKRIPWQQASGNAASEEEWESASESGQGSMDSTRASFKVPYGPSRQSRKQKQGSRREYTRRSSGQSTRRSQNTEASRSRSERKSREQPEQSGFWDSIKSVFPKPWSHVKPVKDVRFA